MRQSGRRWHALAGFSGIGAAAATLVMACSGASPTVSHLRGMVVQETFAAPVTEAVVTAADGTVTRFGVPESGVFELAFDRGTSYRVVFVAEGAEVPLAFSGAHGMYATSLPVIGGGAYANLGLVRNHDPSTLRATIEPPAEPAPRCVDGLYEGGSVPCIGEPAAMICVADDDSDSDSEDDDGEGDHQCEDGIDPHGAICDGGPAANGDDGALEAVDGAVALPQYGLTVLACDDDDEDSDGEEDDD